LVISGINKELKTGRLLLAALFVFSLSAGNTIDGMGEDIEKAGKAVQKSTK
tara:strand:+ start:617 stop:769 length:153 start_codon:yes stop_codon:yes gene_type:complete